MIEAQLTLLLRLSSARRSSSAEVTDELQLIGKLVHCKVGLTGDCVGTLASFAGQNVTVPASQPDFDGQQRLLLACVVSDHSSYPGNYSGSYLGRPRTHVLALQTFQA